MVSKVLKWKKLETNVNDLFIHVEPQVKVYSLETSFCFNQAPGKVQVKFEDAN